MRLPSCASRASREARRDAVSASPAEALCGLFCSFADSGRLVGEVAAMRQIIPFGADTSGDDGWRMVAGLARFATGALCKWAWTTICVRYVPRHWERGLPRGEDYSLLRAR